MIRDATSPFADLEEDRKGWLWFWHCQKIGRICVLAEALTVNQNIYNNANSLHPG